MNIIKLNFEPTATRATGSMYGYATYNDQIKPKIKEDEKNVIVFPDNIKAIGISFVRGMMTDEVTKYGKQGVLEHFEFKSNNENLVGKIIKSINF